MSPIILLYHAKCHDGFAAAVISNMAYANDPDVSVMYVGLDPNRLVDGINELLHLPEESSVLSFDVSFNRKGFELLQERFNEVRIFDHHESTVKNFEGELPVEIHYDIAQCGATLAWNYFFPKKALPLVLQYILARDTWRFDLFGSDRIDETKAICLALYEALQPNYHDITEKQPKIDAWLPFMKGSTRSEVDWFDRMLEYSRILSTHQEIELRPLKKSAVQVKFAGYQVTICNSPVEVSDLGNQLALETKCDFALIWRCSGTTIYISLRSIGDFNVADVATKYGGGGHKNAAAFKCHREYFILDQHNLDISMNQKVQFDHRKRNHKLRKQR